MTKVQPYFEEEIKKTIKTIEEKKPECDMVFALLTDTHLSDNGEHTRENITAVDEKIGFECLVHMGDFLCGNIPEKMSRKILKEELTDYRNTIKSKVIYIAQGNHDGFRDERYKGQLVTDISLDENWYEDTGFIDENENVKRVGEKPYFYVDYPDIELRMIFLCSTNYTHDKENLEFIKGYKMEDEQIEWFANALDVPDGYSIMVFSHIAPFKMKRKDDGEKKVEFILGRNYEKAVELIKTFISRKSVNIDGKIYDYSKSNGDFISWFAGDDHSDFQCEFDGINYLGVTCQTAYIPQLWEPIGEFTGPRDYDTVNEDAWDSVLWNKKERRVFLIRCGTGNDRVIEY